MIILLRPGCQVLLWIRDGRRWGNKIKRQFNSCKYLLEWQVLGKECVSVTSLQLFHGWCEIEYLLSNKQWCHSYPWFWFPKCEFLSLTYKQQRRGTIFHTKNSRMSQPFIVGQAQAISLWAKDTLAQGSGRVAGQGSLRQAIMFAYNNKNSKS